MITEEKMQRILEKRQLIKYSQEWVDSCKCDVALKPVIKAFLQERFLGCSYDDAIYELLNKHGCSKRKLNLAMKFLRNTADLAQAHIRNEIH